MSDYEQKPGYGSLFKNEFKQAEKQPDYKGDLTDPNGKKWQLGAWLKKDKNGKTFMSLRMSEPFQREAQPEPPPYDDEIPF